MGLAARLLSFGLAATAGGAEGYLEHQKRLEEIRRAREEEGLRRGQATRDESRLGMEGERLGLERQRTEAGLGESRARTLADDLRAQTGAKGEQRAQDEARGYTTPEGQRIPGSIERQAMESQTRAAREQRLGEATPQDRLDEFRLGEEQRDLGLREMAAKKEDELARIMSEAAAKADWGSVQAYARKEGITSTTSQLFADWLKADFPKWFDMNPPREIGGGFGDLGADPALANITTPRSTALTDVTPIPPAGGAPSAPQPLAAPVASGTPAPAFSSGALGAPMGQPQEARPVLTQQSGMPQAAPGAQVTIGPTARRRAQMAVQAGKFATEDEAVQDMARKGIDISI